MECQREFLHPGTITKRHFGQLHLPRRMERHRFQLPADQYPKRNPELLVPRGLNVQRIELHHSKQRHHPGHYRKLQLPCRLEREWLQLHPKSDHIGHAGLHLPERLESERIELHTHGHTKRNDCQLLVPCWLDSLRIKLRANEHAERNDRQLFVPKRLDSQRI